jgi:hypothetical protein
MLKIEISVHFGRFSRSGEFFQSHKNVGKYDYFKTEAMLDIPILKPVLKGCRLFDNN